MFLSLTTIVSVFCLRQFKRVECCADMSSIYTLNIKNSKHNKNNSNNYITA